ncbi:MAG: bifunctional alpha/beta hydrolase/OsmC family protein [Methyloligellaceae bacterium]
MARSSQKLTFEGSLGAELAARLDFPQGKVKAFALFAHCFTCSKDIFAASRIAGELSELGFAVLRFDFTGLGASEGEFANTNFSSNVADLVKAADYLRENFEAPKILIGHSLGGAAVLSAAHMIPEALAVATIGAPANADHVVKNFGAKLDEIQQDGVAEVELAGRPFKIKSQFLDDLKSQSVEDKIRKLGKALIIFHAPLDQTVGIENAGMIFEAAKHPKSFVSLDDADHLLSRRSDASYVASVLSAWAERYIPLSEEVEEKPAETVVTVSENGKGKYQQDVSVRNHHLIADEPVAMGGTDQGAAPHEFLAIGLGACTSITLRMYAERKKIPLEHIRVSVTRQKNTDANQKQMIQFDREIELTGELDSATKKRLLEIADKCPVHKTLKNGSGITSKLKN